MVKYNIKTAAAMLGRSQTWIVTRARRAQVRPPEQTGPWYLTIEDLTKLQEIGPRKKKSYLLIISKATGMSFEQVRSLAFNCGLRFRTDQEKIMKACELRKTGEYTIKGIRKRLGIKETV